MSSSSSSFDLIQTEITRLRTFAKKFCDNSECLNILESANLIANQLEFLKNYVAPTEDKSEISSDKIAISQIALSIAAATQHHFLEVKSVRPDVSKTSIAFSPGEHGYETGEMLERVQSIINAIAAANAVLLKPENAIVNKVLVAYFLTITTKGMIFSYLDCDRLPLHLWEALFTRHRATASPSASIGFRRKTYWHRKPENITYTQQVAYENPLYSISESLSPKASSQSLFSSGASTTSHTKTTGSFALSDSKNNNEEISPHPWNPCRIL